MADVVTRYRIRRQAEQTVGEVADQAWNVFIVHYTCESLLKEDGSSPRITAISIRNLASAESKAFSIHLEAEKAGLGIDPDLTSDNFDRLEVSLLEGYYRFLDRHANALWVHWKMRDETYGFAAIDHRAQVLGIGPAPEIPVRQRFDLSELVEAIYGHGYTKEHPHLKELIRLNGLTDKDFIVGVEEPEHFSLGHYRALHNSALRKTSVIRSIFQRVNERSLVTDATDEEIFGSILAARLHFIRADPRYEVAESLFALIGVVGTGYALISALIERF